MILYCVKYDYTPNDVHDRYGMSTDINFILSQLSEKGFVIHTITLHDEKKDWVLKAIGVENKAFVDNL